MSYKIWCHESEKFYKFCDWELNNDDTERDTPTWNGKVKAGRRTWWHLAWAQWGNLMELNGKLLHVVATYTTASSRLYYLRVASSSCCCCKVSTTRPVCTQHVIRTLCVHTWTYMHALTQHNFWSRREKKNKDDDYVHVHARSFIAVQCVRTKYALHPSCLNGELLYGERVPACTCARTCTRVHASIRIGRQRRIYVPDIEGCRQ
jgi:hypothetical protein